MTTRGGGALGRGAGGSHGGHRARDDSEDILPDSRAYLKMAAAPISHTPDHHHGAIKNRRPWPP